MRPKRKQAGFTLIEVIAVLVIIGIMAVGLSMGLVRGVENFIIAGQATQISQQAQVAMARMKKELMEATAITTANATQIGYTYADGTAYSIQNANNEIQLGPVGATQMLMNNINTASTSFAFLQNNGAPWTSANNFDDLAQIRVKITTNSPSLEFETTINPRQTVTLNAPSLN